MAVKKVKISTTKRTKHVKSKKNIAPNQKKAKKTDSAQKGTPKAKAKQQQQKSKQQKSKRRRENAGVPALVNNDEIESDIEADINEMLELDRNNIAPESTDDEQEREMTRRAILLDGVQNGNKNKAKKRKLEPMSTLEDFETEYKQNEEIVDRDSKKIKELLPIKTRMGIVAREIEVEHEKKPKPAAAVPADGDEDDDVGSLKADSDEEFIFGDDDEGGAKAKDQPKSMSVADLLIHRESELQKQKFKIGIICSGILEQPEDRVKNFGSLFEMIEPRTKDGQTNLVSVRKIAMISAAEVFKDIVPDYKLGVQDMESLKLKKTTMNRIAFENVLMQQYKKYLQLLDRATALISKKRTGITEQQIVLGEVATQCLCELLIANPNFNFSQNIAQTLVYLSNCRFAQVRESVNKCFKKIFTSDKRLDLTFFIVRRINHLVKSRENDVFPEVLTALVVLEIKDINLDADKEKELKERKMEARKKRLISLSKREKKRQKKLKELEHEMMETKAEENKQSRGQKLTEIVKMVFNVYFRILKNDPGSKLLGTTLEGLARFAHVINLEFFSDLVNVLNYVMENVELGYREQLHCIQTVFVILSGQGEVLNIDPIRFYTHLYRILHIVHAGKNHTDFLILIRTLMEVLLKRRKQITQQRLLAFTKRIMSVSLQLLHNGSLGCLALIKTIMQTTSKSVDLLLDTESFIGSGRYDAELEDPEFCNANCTLMYELGALRRHYHPVVVKMAKHITNGAPISGEGCLIPELGKLTADEFFLQYDSSSMAFKPSVPAPNQQQVAKQAKGRHMFADSELEAQCSRMLRTGLTPTEDLLDFRFKK